MQLNHEAEYICVCERWEEPVLYPVAELIRCKECKWFECFGCMQSGIEWYRDGNGYCDRAERKEPNTHER